MHLNEHVFEDGIPRLEGAGEALEEPEPDGAKSGRRIVHREPEDPACVPIDEHARDAARERPADDLPPGDAPRPQCHGRRLRAERLERRQEPGDVVGVVAEVGIHVQGDGEPVGAGHPEALDDRGAEAAPAAAHEHMEARLGAGEVEDQLPRAVGGVVVDDEHLEGGVNPEDARHEPRDRSALVVGRRDDEHTPRRPRPRRVEIAAAGGRVRPPAPGRELRVHSANPPRRILANSRR